MDEQRQDQDRESKASLAGSSEANHRIHLLELQHDLERLHQRLTDIAARLLESIEPVGDAADKPHIEPDMDVYENDQEFLIHASLPGVGPEAIRIETTPHTVTLFAECPIVEQAGQVAAGSSQKRHRRSRHAGHERYHFVYTLQAAISPESARAVFRHGIMEIHLPKMRGAPRAVTIPVHLHQETLATHAVTTATQISPPYEMPYVSPLPVYAREGNPSSKMGLAYVPSAAEDHTTKAQSIGESTPPRGTRAMAPQRVAPAMHEIPDDPAAMEARAAGEKL